jgi:tetratricopeptide (TPR) repeat protein
LLFPAVFTLFSCGAQRRPYRTTERRLIPDDTINQILNTACQNLREGAFAEAIDALEKVLEMDVEYPGAASVLKCASFWSEPLERGLVPRDGFERGETLLAHWRLFQVFAQRLADVPERFLFAIKQYVFSSALASYLNASAEQDPTDPDVLLQVGRCCKGIGNYERAIEHLERANLERKEDARILAELADCYSLVNEARLAKVFFREAFFIDAQAIDLAGLESPLITRLSLKVREMGLSGPALNEWVPVWGTIWGVFNVRREMKPLEFGKLKQAIYQMEKEQAGAGRSLVVPRLINRYFWLVDHYLAAGEPRERIEEVLEKIRDLDPGVHREYTT